MLATGIAERRQSVLVLGSGGGEARDKGEFASQGLCDQPVEGDGAGGAEARRRMWGKVPLGPELLGVQGCPSPNHPPLNLGRTTRETSDL